MNVQEPKIISLPSSSLSSLLPFSLLFAFLFEERNCKQSREVGFGAARVRVGASFHKPLERKETERKNETKKARQTERKKAGSCSLQRGFGSPGAGLGSLGSSSHRVRLSSLIPPFCLHASTAFQLF